MAETTGISWADATWNPWQGCRKVSEACKFCYMYRDKARYGQDPTVVHRSAKGTFRSVLNHKDFLSGARVFTCSWSDWFIEEADDWRPEAWEIIRQRPDLVFMILTKRPERIKDHLPHDWGHGWPNVWLGVTVENQAAADLRIPQLLMVPAPVRFLSCEPLLGPLDLTQWLGTRTDGIRNDNYACTKCGYVGDGENWNEPTGEGDFNVVCPECEAREYEIPEVNCGVLDWIIAGGESGPNARPSHPDWFRSLRNQAKAVGVAFHFKQWGEHIPVTALPDGAQSSGQVNMEPQSLIGMWMTRVGTKRAGRLLDGLLHDQIPNTQGD